MGVGADLLAQPGLEAGLLADRQFIVGTAELALRPDVQQRQRLAMQPVGAPVRSDVGAVAPDGPQLHATDRLPDLASGLDVVLRVQHLAAFALEGGGHRRRLAVDLAAHPQQHGEGGYEQQAQDRP